MELLNLNSTETGWTATVKYNRETLSVYIKKLNDSIWVMVAPEGEDATLGTPVFKGQPETMDEDGIKQAAKKVKLNDFALPWEERPEEITKSTEEKRIARQLNLFG
ncbi:MAG: hypothetical protein Q8O94_03030 [bacterium]|nr:hypothetical protein [bacterium]